MFYWRSRFVKLDIQEGETIQLCVILVESPDSFWAQLTATSNSDLPLLQDELQDYYSHCTTRPSDVVVGQACAAQYLDVWYRAEIQSIEGHQVQVHFVDYGNSDFAEKSDVRDLPESFLKLPRQSFRCALTSVKPAGKGTWDEASCNRFEELVGFGDGQEFTFKVARIASKPDGQLDCVWGLLLDGDISAAQHLIDGGYAVLDHVDGETSGPPDEAEKPATEIETSPVEMDIPAGAEAEMDDVEIETAVVETEPAAGETEAAIALHVEQLVETVIRNAQRTVKAETEGQTQSEQPSDARASTPDRGDADVDNKGEAPDVGDDADISEQPLNDDGDYGLKTSCQLEVPDDVQEELGMALDALNPQSKQLQRKNQLGKLE